jgi:hypothetical protein
MSFDTRISSQNREPEPNIWKNNPNVPNHPPVQYVLDDATTDWQALAF